MTTGILTEKPSAARNFAAALGGMKGTYAGTDYVITSARGHLFELAPPEKQVSPDLSGQVKDWGLGNLPWDHTWFSWERVLREGARDTVSTLKRQLSGVEEIVIATDVDPTGEGQLIAWEIIDELGLHNKKITRMNFTDESAKSLQKAFKERKPLPKMQDDPEYRKADLRNRWDMLSMQFTRVATKTAAQGAILRQGRLKSAIVKLVGDQLKAYHDYKPVPWYQNRFRDENGVVYTDPDAPQFKAKAEVPGGLSASKVVFDKAENKRTAPPRLMDLAAISARLASKGIKAADVLGIYQKMYENQIVSYPRTEDKVITTEQFNELLPLVDKIAAVVGADVSKLTHRTPRRTHVKDAGVAHGANRPGTKVPASLDALKSQFGTHGDAAVQIYTLLAKNYLAMLAEDYVYEQQTGHVEDYPSYVGVANVPKELGFKAVFSLDEDDDEKDENESKSGLGQNAEPFVHEGVPRRPAHPTMKWLMAQLEKRDVGTGATRTSTYADVTSSKTKYPLLSESRGKITLTDFGGMSHLLLKDSRIGDLSVTEGLMKDMASVGRGEKNADEVLAQVAEWVVSDITTMTNNAAPMREELGLTEMKEVERVSGTFQGKPVKFKREWSGHVFTDEEVEKLLAGEEIVVEAISSRTKKPFKVSGKLGEGEFKGKTFFGFQPDFNKDTGFPESFLGHTFTQEESERLQAGEVVVIEGLWSAKKKRNFDAPLSWGVKPGEKRKSFIFHFDD